MSVENRTGVVVLLGVTQTISWGCSFYLPGVLADVMARGLGLSASTLYAALSFALMLSALLGPAAGRAIDRWGGRPVLCATNLVFAIGLALLSMAQGIVTLFIAWAVLGIAMGAGLYDAAFATAVRHDSRRARGAITGITLIAGFSSTVSWPLSMLMEAHLGWRGACLGWMALQLFVSLPLNWLLPPAKAALAPAASPAAPVTAQADQSGESTALPEAAASATASAGGAATSATASIGEAATSAATATASAYAPPWQGRKRDFALLAVMFMLTLFIGTAVSAHMPQILQACGLSLAAAASASALMGPSQVGARILELGLLRRLHPMFPARLATVLIPVSTALLLTLGVPIATIFTLGFGAGNGLLTIARGTLPLMIFGARGYGALQGMLMVPARIAQGLAPWLFGLMLDHWGIQALWLLAAFSLVSLGTLMALRAEEPERPSR